MRQYRTLVILAALGSIGILLSLGMQLSQEPAKVQAQAALIQAAYTIMLVSMTAISIHAMLAHQKRPYIIEIIKKGIFPALQILYMNIFNLERKRLHWQQQQTETLVKEVMLDLSGASPFYELNRKNPKIHASINACNVRLGNLKVLLARLSSAILTREFVDQCRSAYEEFTKLHPEMKPSVEVGNLHFSILTLVIDDRDRVDDAEEWYLKFWEAYKSAFLRFRDQPEVAARIRDVEAMAADLLREYKTLRNLLENVKMDYRREYNLLLDEINPPDATMAAIEAIEAANLRRGRS